MPGPLCRDPLTPETLRHPTGFLKNYLEDLKIKCDHHDRGCTDEVRLEDLQRHVDKCGFTPVVCGIEECGMVVNKKDKENHERNLCQFRIIRSIKAGGDFKAFPGNHCFCLVDLLLEKLLYIQCIYGRFINYILSKSTN